MTARDRLLAAALGGAASGVRSFTGIAALTATAWPDARTQPDRFLAHPAAKALVGLAGTQEYVLDKLPATPSRLQPLGLVTRLTGAAASAVVVARRVGTDQGSGSPPADIAEPAGGEQLWRALSCVGVAAVSAAASAWLGLRWRSWAADAVGADWVAAAVEDLAAAGLAGAAVAVVERAGPAGSVSGRGVGQWMSGSEVREGVRMSSVTESVDVAVPVTAAYNQWTRFESFPEFMNGVESISQTDATHLHWVVSVAGVNREFDAEVTEQHPDERVAWKSTDGTTHAGVVTFHKLDDDHARVTVQIDWQPEGLAEKAGAVVGADDRQVKADLKRFKELVETTGGDSGWRGDVPRD